ncbi:MAG: terminase family protein, partial [Kiritimatiellae bacterium]|nr:terminase family protein [Kiritimatiellia bacterium]
MAGGIDVYYRAHPAQVQIHAARGKRFRCVCTGRRFGKTICLAGELLDVGGGTKGGEYGWVAPTYNVAERGVEAFRKIAPGFVEVVGRAPCRVEFQGEAGLQRTRVWFLSADNPDAIRGYGFEGLVIDEAASIPKDVWHYVLRPTISQTMGWAIFVSTPKGRNWFYDLFTRGQDSFERDYASFRFPSSASPYFPAEEWEEAKRTLPEDVFRQEYMAEFLEDSAGVFRNVDACLEVRGQESEVRPECVRSVVIGCDVAKHTDWTVLIAMDAETGRCFAMERFNMLDWPIQKERIVGFARKWRGRVVMDATGVGDPIFDDLKRVLPDIEGFRFTAGSKVELVQRLAVAIEQRKVSWPGGWGVGSGQAAGGSGQAAGGSGQLAVGSKQCGGGLPTANCSLPTDPWEVLTAELKRYEYEIGPTGQISYGAPAGYHDDCVMALALANHRRWECETCGSMERLG